MVSGPNYCYIGPIIAPNGIPLVIPEINGEWASMVTYELCKGSTTLHHTTPHYTAPHRTTPRHTTPHTTPHHPPPGDLCKGSKLIANPNCTTAIALVSYTYFT